MKTAKEIEKLAFDTILSEQGKLQSAMSPLNKQDNDKKGIAKC